MSVVSPITENLRRVGDGPAWLAVPSFASQDWLWHGFSTRQGGVSRAYLPTDVGQGGELNLGFTAADVPGNVRENRLLFVEAVTGSRETPLVTVRQIHSGVSVVAPGGGQATPAEADGLMTAEPGILLGIQTADCIPVLVADPVRRAVAAFHAGWRGTVAGIVESGVAQMRSEFGSNPGDLIAAIGPGIGPCCYSVGDEVLREFKARFGYADNLFQNDESGLRLNLIEANRRQLLSAGLHPYAISVAGGCTGCQSDWLYSHRMSGGHAGRLMSVIGLR